MMTLHRSIVSVVALLFAGLGLWLILQPRAVEGLYPMRLDGPMAISEIRAVFGGLMLGVGAALAWLVWGARRAVEAGMATVLVFGGLLVARLAGLVGEGVPEGPVLNETILETVVFVVVLITTLAIRERRLVFDLRGAGGAPAAEFHLALGPFRQVVKDYFQICESYFDAVKHMPPSRIEAIDMARRGIHDEGARLLQERLEGKVETDKPTARRLFTLICVLHFGA